jgi:hypothetical protein
VNTGKQVGVVSWGYGCADPLYPGGTLLPIFRFYLSNSIWKYLTNTLLHLSFLIVYSRVSAAYDNFIGPYITSWSNPTTSPPNSYARPISSTTTEHVLGCTDMGGFYDSDGVDYNCMWYAGSVNGVTRCSKYGNDFAHAGLTANMACCVCSATSQPTSRKPTSQPTSRKPTSPKTTRRPTSSKPTRKPTSPKPNSRKPSTSKPIF